MTRKGKKKGANFKFLQDDVGFIIQDSTIFNFNLFIVLLAPQTFKSTVIQ